MSKDVTRIEIGYNAVVSVWRDGDWTILYVEDGSGAITTVSLTAEQATKLAKNLPRYTDERPTWQRLR